MYSVYSINTSSLPTKYRQIQHPYYSFISLLTSANITTMGSLCGTMIIILAMLPAILTMADPYCDCDCPQQCEVKLHYYLHQFRAGADHPNRNEEFVTSGGPSGLGAGLIHDWSLTTGLDPNVNIVGRAQGWHIVASQSSPANWYLSQNIVFQDR